MGHGGELLVVAAAACILTSLGWHVRMRRRPLRVLQAALGDGDGELRHAAVLIAARHGISRYLEVLLDMIDTEPSERVRTALAEAAVDGYWKHADTESRSVRLRAWGAGVLSEPGRRRRPDCPVGGHGGPSIGIDALELMEAAERNQSESQDPPGAVDGRGDSRRMWIPDLDEIDALEIVYALTSAKPTRRTAIASVAGAGRSAETLALAPAPGDVRDDLDALTESLVLECQLAPGSPLRSPSSMSGSQARSQLWVERSRR